MTGLNAVGRPSPLEARLAEAEDQCRFERTKRVELAALVAGFIQRAVPLINAAGLSLDPREFIPSVPPTSRIQEPSRIDPATLIARVKATKNSDELDALVGEVGGILEQGFDAETMRLVTPTGTLEWDGADYTWTPAS